QRILAIGGWRFAGGSMRSLVKVGTVATVAITLLLANAPAVLAQATGVINELNKRISELYHAGRYSAAIPLAQRVLSIQERQYGRDHLDICSALQNLAALYEWQGNFDEAEKLFTRALAIKEKAIGSDSPVLIDLLTDLGVVYRDQDRYVDAERTFMRALAIATKNASTADPLDYASLLNNFGLLYTYQGHFAEAEAL